MTTSLVFYAGATLPFSISTADILVDIDGISPPLDASEISFEGYRMTRNSEGENFVDPPVIYTLAGGQIARVSQGEYEVFHRNAQAGFWLWKTAATLGGRDFVSVISLQVEEGPG